VFSITRGKRLKTADQVSGSIAYISSTKVNNGIDNYVMPPEKHPIFNNAITLNNSGSIGYCFYHSYDFIASDHCTILDVKDENVKLDAILFLFLKPVIETMKQKYGFAREMSNNRLNKEKILLPVQDNLPDWEYMRNYIKNKAKDVIYNKIVQYPRNSMSLDSIKWIEFKVSDLFWVKGSKTTPKLTLDKYGYGKYPYITTRATNNGINGFYDHYTERGNVLTIDSATIGHTTYQEQNFSASDHVEKLIPINSNNFNKYIALFFKTILNKEQYRYAYGRKFNQTRIKETVINIPVNDSNQPDWQFMEYYIKSLPYSKSL
jgi:restriction endonuclease S subunit